MAFRNFRNFRDSIVEPISHSEKGWLAIDFLGHMNRNRTNIRIHSFFMTLSTTDLKNLVKLSEQKDAIQAKLDSINAKIDSAVAGKSGSAKAVLIKAKVGKKASGRSNLKGLITEFLKSAEGATVPVKELASKLGIKNQSVHVWFNTTGKKIEEIKKVGAGAYAWITAPLTPEPAAKPKKVKKAPAKKAKTAPKVAKVKKPAKAKKTKAPKAAAPKKAEPAK